MSKIVVIVAVAVVLVEYYCFGFQRRATLFVRGCAEVGVPIDLALMQPVWLGAFSFLAGWSTFALAGLIWYCEGLAWCLAYGGFSFVLLGLAPILPLGSHYRRIAATTFIRNVGVRQSEMGDAEMLLYKKVLASIEHGF